MTSRPIVQLGNAILKQVSRDVPESAFGSSALRKLVREMKLAMQSDDGCGLAAPQLGESQRIFVVSLPDDMAPLDPVPFTVFVNPVLKLDHSRTIQVWESCLSVPGLAGLVPRAARADIEYRDVEGRLHRARATGFLAAVLQHEYDHLDGLVFLNRMPADQLLPNLVARSELHNLPPERIAQGAFEGTWHAD